MAIKVRIILYYTLFLCVVLTSCHSTALQKYYSQKDNYVDAIGTITYMSYNKNGDTLYLEFDNLLPSFDDTCFKIIGKNLTVIQGKDFEENVNIGDTIEFISAPRYFGDGYIMPIVAISKGEMTFLEFEEGYRNFTEWLEEN